MPTRRRRPLALLALAGCVCWSAYLAIAVLSRQFAPGQDFGGATSSATPSWALKERPILAILGLLALAFGSYLAAIWAATRAREDRWLLGLIVAGSVVFRFTLVFSWPIQEIDIYRYLWDGEVAAHGISPFRYSPQQVLDASADDALPPDLRRLVQLRDSSPTTATILSRVHYEELPTVYPPVSQAVFALCALTTPGDSTVFCRLAIMKGCFVLFDLATLAVVIGLLRFAGQHVGWSLAYGWCPLVIKEIANSGHLDSVAVFLTSLAVLIALRATSAGTSRHAFAGAALAASVLGLAVGAKLYPVVLMPLFVITWIRRLGLRRAAVPAGAFAAVVLVVLWPMVRWAETGTPEQRAATAPIVDRQDPSSGLRAFFGRWEINDFVFLLLVENVRPDQSGSPDPSPWFVIIPQSWRSWLADGVADGLGVKPSAVAFPLARLVTSAVFIALALILAWRAAELRQPAAWLRAAFLTVAWLWLLLPTQNPWYWTWAMPLVAFARSKAWFAVSGLALVYYLRFWLGYHWPQQPVLGTAYHGKLFFDYVVTWLEFAPWFVWLAIDAWHHRKM